MHRRTTLLLSVIALWLAQVVPGAAADRVLAGADYFPAVRAALRQAARSIDIQMYFIIADPTQPGDPVTALVEELVAAHQRGVRVRVVLEDSKSSENNVAYQQLRQQGVEVQFDAAVHLLHTKAVVVDRRVCLVGSANWSRAAFHDNHELSLQLESPALAEQILAAFDQVDRRPELAPAAATATTNSTVPGLRLPREFLLAGGAGPRMVTDRADAAFQLYLALAAQAARAGTNTITWDAPALARQVPFGNLRRPRTRLEHRYHLLRYDRSNQTVTLLDGVAPSLLLPDEFWAFGLNRRLTLRGQFAWLVCLAEADLSSRRPCWFRSQDDLGARYGISPYTLSLGLLELERENLVEIHRADSTATNAPAARLANVYCLNALVPPSAWTDWETAQRRRYGPKVWPLAQRFAADLNEPRDPQVLTTLADLIERYGADAVRRAHAATIRLKPGSARRSLPTTIAALAAPEK